MSKIKISHRRYFKISVPYQQGHMKKKLEHLIRAPIFLKSAQYFKIIIHSMIFFYTCYTNIMQDSKIKFLITEK